jgi:hypothetical protein
MPEQLVKVFTRRITEGQISMWGTLHLNAQGGRLAGWLCDSWTEAGTPAADMLMPRLHWFSMEHEQFYLAKIDIPVVGGSSIMIGEVDTEIEPRRKQFMLVTLAQWLNEYLTTQGVQVS